MNEQVVPGGKGKDWLGPPFAGKHFVQFITLDQADRPRPDIARQWIHHLAAAIREKDKRHLITVGLVDWSLDWPGGSNGQPRMSGRSGWRCITEIPHERLTNGMRRQPMKRTIFVFFAIFGVANVGEQRFGESHAYTHSSDGQGLGRHLVSVDPG